MEPMDNQARRDIETMAKWAAQMDAWERLAERRHRLGRILYFWLNPHQVAIEPTVAEPTPGANVPSSHLGVGPGAAGSTDTRPPTPLTTSAVGRPVPGSPHLHSLDAVRISGGITWN